MYNANEILFRCSSLHHVAVGMDGITDKQLFRLNELQARKNGEGKPLTANMEDELKELIAKRDNRDLPSGVKTHLIDVYTASKYGRFEEITGKMLEKGNDTEEESITTVSLQTGCMFRKNEEHLSNEYIKGTPDLFTGESIRNADTVRDTKSSWSIFTFNRSVFKKLEDSYYWQLQGYAALTGAKKLYIDFCLNNTPLHLIQWELYQQNKKQPDGKLPTWAQMQVVANHVYDKETFDLYLSQLDLVATDEFSKAIYHGFVPVPLSERHHAVEFERNDEDIKKLYQRIRDCRIWMNKYLFKVQQDVAA